MKLTVFSLFLIRKRICVLSYPLLSF